MKKLGVLFLGAFLTMQVMGQTLLVPTDLTIRQDSTYWGGQVPYLITTWQTSGWIARDASNSTASTSAYTITDYFDASNTDLNTIESNGGDITGWTMYLKCADSTFFADTVPAYWGGNTRKIEGRNTIQPKTWGEYFDENVEIYHNSYNDQYIVPAIDDSGNPLPLSVIIDVRNDYSSVTGYYSIQGLADVNQANLTHRDDW